MTCLRPATPGFIITLAATILLAVVVFGVPFGKTVYFLNTSVNDQGNITFGTLGFCVQLPANTTCTKPSIGYQLDVNRLVSLPLSIQIPQVVGKWVTYALFLHVVALIAAATSTIFGLLAHIREMAMACFSTFFSSLAATVTFFAFVFDIVLFFIAKAGIKGRGSARIGSATWLTLIAFVLLSISGCFYALGRCCIRDRPNFGAGGGRNWFGKRDTEGGPDKNYSEEMRLDAVKAEADRKARQKQGEIGLPAFYETQPLTGYVEGDHVHLDKDHKAELTPPPSANFQGGYSPGAMGTRSVDDYYRRDHSPAPTVYPPQQEVRRQRSEHSPHDVPTTTATPPISYTRPSGYGQYNNVSTSSPPPVPSNQLLLPSAHHQPYNNPFDPYGREYGHTAGGSSYHTAVSHDQGPSSYGQPNDSYAAYQPQQTQPHRSHSTYEPDPYMPAFASHPPMPQPDYYTSTSPPPVQQLHPLHQDRTYTVGGDGYWNGGDGYGDNKLPPPDPAQSLLPPGAGAPSYVDIGQQHLPPIDTNVSEGYLTGGHFHTSPGPNDAPPPGYDSDMR